MITSPEWDEEYGNAKLHVERDFLIVLGKKRENSKIDELSSLPVRNLVSLSEGHTCLIRNFVKFCCVSPNGAALFCFPIMSSVRSSFVTLCMTKIGLLTTTFLALFPRSHPYIRKAQLG